MATKKELVIEEIRRRAAAGHSLKSGSNRGDWLYAAAVREFRSWGRAIDAAGLAYREIKGRPLSKIEVRRRLRELIQTGEPVLAKDHPKLREAAVRHFGSWKEALAALGHRQGTRWTKHAVVAAIREHLAKELAVTSNEMRRRDENLYMAGRRQFGSWAAAVKAAQR
ncbi:MAG: hypothetical protein KF901_01845 [Myxococcales bacterium]|nr:hypothetical protein [Myxococcales bacterium]